MSVLCTFFLYKSSRNVLGPRGVCYFIVAVIVVSAIRRKDFRDQVTGKKPERKADPNQKVSYDKPSHENSQISIDREVLRTKSGQNLLGPK